MQRAVEHHLLKKMAFSLQKTALKESLWCCFMLDWPLRQYQMKFYFWKMFPDFVIFYQAIIILWDWIYSIDCVSTTTNDFAKVSDQLLRLLTFVLPEYVQETFASDICYQIGITCNKSFKTFQKEPEYPVNNQKQWNFCIFLSKAVLRKLFRVALLITVLTNKYYPKRKSHWSSNCS